MVKEWCGCRRCLNKMLCVGARGIKSHLKAPRKACFFPPSEMNLNLRILKPSRMQNYPLTKSQVWGLEYDWELLAICPFWLKPALLLPPLMSWQKWQPTFLIKENCIYFDWTTFHLILDFSFIWLLSESFLSQEALKITGDSIWNVKTQ